jgi:hypothetical protein
MQKLLINFNRKEDCEMDLPTLIGFISTFGFGKNKSTKTELDKNAEEIAKALADVSTVRGNSIKYKAKGLIAQYPVLYSDNVTSGTVQLLNRALEHEYVNLIKLLIQNEKTISADVNTREFLKRYHDNIYNDRVLDSTLNDVKNESLVLEKHIDEVSREYLTPIEEDLNYRTLNEDTITKEYKKLMKENNIILEANDDDKKEEKPRVVKHDSAEANISQLEIKKANELTPTNVSVDISVSKGNTIHQRKITFGVKCVAHLLNSEDIEYYLPNSVITRTPIMKLIKWTTGEIKFFRDFLLSVDEIKKTAIKGNQRNNFWWRKLQELSRIAHMNPIFKRLIVKGEKGYNQPIPITTMVITKENVDNIRYRHGIDLLEKPALVTKIMKNFFLMTFIIVDESIETVYIFNDETRDFSTYSFKSLENFSKQKNIDIRDIYNLLK